MSELTITDLRLVTLCSHGRFTAHPQGFGPYCYEGEVGDAPTRKQLIDIFDPDYEAAARLWASQQWPEWNLDDPEQQRYRGYLMHSIRQIVDTALGEDT